MRQKSLIAAAAAILLAGTVFASAQGMQKQGPGGGAMEKGAAQGQEHSPGAAQKGEDHNGQRHRNRAQGEQKEPKGTVGQGQKAEPKAHEGGSKSQRSQSKEPRTSGQGEEHSPKAGRSEHDSSPKAGRDQKNEPKAHQSGQKGEPRTQGQRTGAGGAVTLTTEQRTKIRQTVIKGGHAPRVNKVNFSISVGTVVPRSVKVVTVPTVIVDIHPAWRGFLYFVYEDQVIIVDHDHHIVAILAV